jgi:hypothetical protein
VVCLTHSRSMFACAAGSSIMGTRGIPPYHPITHPCTEDPARKTTTDRECSSAGRSRGMWSCTIIIPLHASHWETKRGLCDLIHSRLLRQMIDAVLEGRDGLHPIRADVESRTFPGRRKHNVHVYTRGSSSLLDHF